MRLQTIVKEEFVLDYREFLIEKRRNGRVIDNKTSFENDVKSGLLDRYQETYVAYKKGILCGQSKDEKVLRKNVDFMLYNNNIDLFYVPKKR